MLTRTALVITSISAPNRVLTLYAEESHRHGVDFIVIGDVASPLVFQLPGCDYWSLEAQKKASFRLAGILPERHYARKNIGYLIAMDRGVTVIIETDDDNVPLETFWGERNVLQKAALLEDKGWVNVYRHFTDAPVWPRGFPLEHVQAQALPVTTVDERDIYCPIQQGLANGNPDVDAVYRLVKPLPLQFGNRAPVAFGRGCWSPFNSQNTTWFRDAFPLLYLPSHCSFRMCDIWRSFIALRICWANDWGVLFHGPTVYQERNEHDLLRDFSDEIPGYLNNARICRELGELDIKKGSQSIGENLRRCYRAFITLGLVHEKEMPLLDAWIADMDSIIQR